MKELPVTKSGDNLKNKIKIMDYKPWNKINVHSPYCGK